MARWGYALNQWKPNFDFFTRREQHERAFKTISAAGFSGVELKAGTGRWEPLGRPEQIAANFGSAAGLLEFLHACGLENVSSFFFDPGEPNNEEPAPARSPTVAADHRGILESARIFAEFLREVGGDCLVVRAMPSFWREGPLSDEQIDHAATCWDAVGKMAADTGVQLALHVDFLSLLRTEDDIAVVLERTDPRLVGLAVDTAELAIAGIDPASLVRRCGSRIRHVHLKDARATVGDEYRRANAEKNVLLAGGDREIARWFWELGEGSIDFPAVMTELRAADYGGWLVVESDESPDPASSTMLNGWTVQRVLRSYERGVIPTQTAQRAG